jgi:hypothetical protein
LDISLKLFNTYLRWQGLILLLGMMPKYVITLLAYSIINLDPYSDITTIHRRPSASGQPKPATKLVTILKTAAPVAAAAASSVGGTGWTVLSIADA